MHVLFSTCSRSDALSTVGECSSLCVSSISLQYDGLKISFTVPAVPSTQSSTLSVLPLWCVCVESLSSGSLVSMLSTD